MEPDEELLLDPDEELVVLPPVEPEEELVVPEAPELPDELDEDAESAPVEEPSVDASVEVPEPVLLPPPPQADASTRVPPTTSTATGT